MAVTQTSISYYGFQSAKQSAPDFKEMVDYPSESGLCLECAHPQAVRVIVEWCAWSLDV